MAASQPPTPAQPKVTPTWHGTIKNYFTPCEINCMRLAVQLDLSSYDDVKLHAQNIWEQVSEHNMPMGGPYWSDEWVQTFRDWIDAGFPQGVPQQLAGPTRLAAAMLTASPSRMRQDVATLASADVELLRTAFRGMMAKDPKTAEEGKEILTSQATTIRQASTGTRCSLTGASRAKATACITTPASCPGTGPIC